MKLKNSIIITTTFPLLSFPKKGELAVAASGVNLLIDAEHSHLQPAVRAIALAAMKRFNTGTAISPPKEVEQAGVQTEGRENPEEKGRT